MNYRFEPKSALSRDTYDKIFSQGGVDDDIGKLFTQTMCFDNDIDHLDLRDDYKRFSYFDVIVYVNDHYAATEDESDY